MHRIGLLAVGLIAFIAVAGTRAKDSAGAAPTATTDGVGMGDAVGCRASIRVDGGGTIGTGTKLVYHYYDPVLLWSESTSALTCTVTARADGGTRSAYVCPDLEPLARFGRVAVSNFGLIGSDGGTGFGLGTDGGYNVAPVTRIECWGSSIP